MLIYSIVTLTEKNTTNLMSPKPMLYMYVFKPSIQKTDFSEVQY